jgi:hypothetical protein
MDEKSKFLYKMENCVRTLSVYRHRNVIDSVQELVSGLALGYNDLIMPLNQVVEVQQSILG